MKTMSLLALTVALIGAPSAIASSTAADCPLPCGVVCDASASSCDLPCEPCDLPCAAK